MSQSQKSQSSMSYSAKPKYIPPAKIVRFINNAYICLQIRRSLKNVDMMSRQLFSLVFAMVLLCPNGVHAQKKVYIPKELRGMDLENDTSRWSFQRSIETPDLIFMWEKGFGQDLNHPPLLDGKPMAFRLDNIRYRAQQFYHFFRDTLGWVKGPSKADRYKMMVMIKYSLDGKAYGGSYDNFIGALWVTPNFLQNEKMNAIAHELGHCFQHQIVADSVGQSWRDTGFKEMTSQWMLWQVNPDWVTDEIDHLAAFRKLTHKAFLHKDNIYHSPYVIQWWSDLHGRKSIAELYRQHRTREDAATTYMRMYGLDQSAFCDAGDGLVPKTCPRAMASMPSCWTNAWTSMPKCSRCVSKATTCATASWESPPMMNVSTVLSTLPCCASLKISGWSISTSW